MKGKWRRRALVPVMLGCAGLAGCSVPDDNHGKAGSLTYSGDFNGKAEFADSDCAVVNDQLISLNAPRVPGDKQVESGPFVGLIYMGPLPSVMFTPDAAGGAHFMLLRADKGVTVNHDGDDWSVTLNLDIYDDNIVNQKKVTLNGTLHCTDYAGNDQH